MGNTKILTLTLLLLESSFFCLNSYSQNTNERSIDPRSYIKIYEVERSTNKKILIYDGTNINTAFLNPLVGRFIDPDNLILISFDKNGLSTNQKFVGNFTLSAFINDREISVKPYTSIGNEYKRRGLKSKPVIELAQSFSGFKLNFLEVDNLTNDFINNYNSFDQSTVKRENDFLKIKLQKEKNEEIKLGDLTFSQRQTILNSLNYLWSSIYNDKLNVIMAEDTATQNYYTIKELKDICNSIDNSISESKYINLYPFIKETLVKLNDQLPLFTSYIDDLFNQDDFQRGLFLKLMATDKIEFEKFKKSLSTLTDTLLKMNPIV